MASSKSAFRQATIALLAFLPASSGSVSATSIVALKTTSELIVAADSAQGDDGTLDLQLCKIRRANDVFVAIAGYVEYEYTAFNAYDIAFETFGSSGPVDPLAERHQQFETRVVSEMITALRHTSLNRPDFYRSVFERRLVLETLVFGNGKDGPFYYRRSYVGQSARSNPLLMLSTFGDCLANCTKNAFLGVSAPIQVFRTKSVDSWKMPLSDAATMLVRRVMKASPQDVGGEIDVIRVTRDGACWVRHKKHCETDIPNCQRTVPVRKRTPDRRSRPRVRRNL